MGKGWDDNKGGRDQWIAWLSSIMKECYRVLKPGGHAFVWALPRTSHWTGMALELSGFEVRDCVSYLYDSGRDVTAFLETLSAEQRALLEIIMSNHDDSYNSFLHVFGSGFPKSLNVGAAIDQHLGMEREVVGQSENWRPAKTHGGAGFDKLGQGVATMNITAPSSAEAKQWDGWHTSLKPGFEQWWLVRKPLSEPTVAANVLRWGVGGINVDASRIEINDTAGRAAVPSSFKPKKAPNGTAFFHGTPMMGESNLYSEKGRFPANIIIDGSDPVEAEFAKAGVSASKASARGGTSPNPMDWGKYRADGNIIKGHSDSGSASRFFYCAKPSSRERNEGLDGFEEGIKNTLNSFGSQEDFDCPDGANRKGDKGSTITRNIHPTVKSINLMKYLVTMITPKGGTVLDCFMGSGSTGVAAMKGNFSFIGIEKEAEYFAIAEARIRHAACGQQGEIHSPNPLPVKARIKLQLEMF